MSLTLNLQQCHPQESLQAPTRKVLGTEQSPSIYYSQGCPGGGRSCQEEGQAGAWRLVSASAGENWEGEDKNSQQNWSPAKLSTSQASSESQQMLLTPEAAAHSHKHFQA